MKSFSILELEIKQIKLGVVVHTCNLSTLEAEEGRLKVQGQPGPHSKALSQKQKNKKKMKSNNILNKITFWVWYELLSLWPSLPQLTLTVWLQMLLSIYPTPYPGAWNRLSLTTSS
jgi:hypothetical protein